MDNVKMATSSVDAYLLLSEELTTLVKNLKGSRWITKKSWPTSNGMVQEDCQAEIARQLRKIEDLSKDIPPGSKYIAASKGLAVALDLALTDVFNTLLPLADLSVLDQGHDLLRIALDKKNLIDGMQGAEVSLGMFKEIAKVAPGNNVDFHGFTALMEAAKINEVDDIDVLLPNANPNQVDHRNMTALMYAAFNDNLDVVARLLPVTDTRIRAKPEPGEKKGSTALDLAIAAGATECVRLIQNHQKSMKLSGTIKAADQSNRRNPSL